MKLALAIYALVVVILLGMIWTYNQPQPLAVEEIPIAPACAPRANPCATMRCEVKVDTRGLT